MIIFVKDIRYIRNNTIFLFLVSGGSFTPADNNYIGFGPFSEPETRTLSNYIVNEIGWRLTGYLNFRSFGQRIVIPFAHTDDLLYNYGDVVSFVVIWFPKA